MTTPSPVEIPWPVLSSSTLTSFSCANALALIHSCCTRGASSRRSTALVAGSRSAPATGPASGFRFVGQSRLELAGHVDVVVELVDEEHRDRIADLFVLDQLGARVLPRLGVEHLAMDPCRQDRREPDQRCDDDQRPDQLRVTATPRAPSSASVAASGGGAVVEDVDIVQLRSVSVGDLARSSTRTAH